MFVGLGIDVDSGCVLLQCLFGCLRIGAGSDSLLLQCVCLWVSVFLLLRVS